jgi:hypothetical protein
MAMARSAKNRKQEQQAIHFPFVQPNFGACQRDWRMQKFGQSPIARMVETPEWAARPKVRLSADHAAGHPA